MYMHTHTHTHILVSINWQKLSWGVTQSQRAETLSSLSTQTETQGTYKHMEPMIRTRGHTVRSAKLPSFNLGELRIKKKKKIQ